MMIDADLVRESRVDRGWTQQQMERRRLWLTGLAAASGASFGALLTLVLTGALGS